MPSTSRPESTTVEAKVTSKGQVTLPSALRKRLGIHTGSRIRFSIPASGAVSVERVMYEMEDLWKLADEGARPAAAMTFEEMNAAKVRRQW
jgi:antitoxin PrlF